MDDASEDSRPAQPGFVKKIYLTISQVKALNRMLNVLKVLQKVVL